MAHAPSRYELLDRIAVGGMAEVFRAKAYGAHGFEKTLAIKRILPELAKDPEFEERFIAEAKLAVELSHANVVQVLDFGRFAGTLFIAMELVNGLDLAALLKFYSDKGERIPIPAAFQIAIEIVRGLSFAHQNQVVHRDVSPSNILLSKAGEVKIADFGIATAMQGDPGKDKGRIMGKWRYMSPEQTQADNLTESSDLFSAATVIYEIFSGAKLFPGNESKDIIENIHCMPIPALAELRPGVPVALDEILGRALERNVDKRIRNGDEMLRALTEASYKSSIVATSIDVAEAVAQAADAGVSGASVKPADVGEVDDIIRAQLAGVNQFSSPERHTEVATDPARAVTELQTSADDGGTMVRRGVDSVGVTIWELDRETIAAVPAAKRRRTTQLPAALPPQKAGRYESSSGEESTDSLRRIVVYSGIAFASLVLLSALFIGSGPVPQPVVVEFDASAIRLAEAAPVLSVDSSPQGARVRVNGVELADPTPVDYQVAADTALEVEIRLDGYEEYRETQTLKSGDRLRIVPTLKPYVSSLRVGSSPQGAMVILDGHELGPTPLIEAELRPGNGRKLELRLKDYKRVEVTINLLRNEWTEVSKTLKSTVVYGFVRIVVPGSWAHVYEGNKKIGVTERKISLRVGRHKLRLVNTSSGKEKTVTVDVVSDRLVTKSFEL